MRPFIKYIIFITFLLISSTSFGQVDTSSTMLLRVDTSKGFPALGLDSKGGKYFILLPKQEKALLTTLYQSMYTDSLFQRSQQLELINEKINKELLAVNRKMVIKIVEYEKNISDLNESSEKKDEIIYGLGIVNKGLSSQNKKLQKENRFNKAIGIGGIALGVTGIIFGIVN